MEKNNSDKLDKWLSKNVSRQTDKNRKVTSYKKQQSNMKRFFTRKKKHNHNTPEAHHNKLRIIPIGGLNEVGQNMAVLEYGNDMIVIDMGFQFPEEDMLGVDYVLPDFSYVQKNKNKVRGVIITHGHLDHIGAIPYVAPKLDNPNLYGTKLTMGLVHKRMEEFGLLKQSKLNEIKPEDTLKLGCFRVSFFRVNHSIPDCVGIIIETPAGIIVHTGDFKFDLTPADGVLADMDKLSDLGSKNVLLLMSDSTNATKPGHTMSEAVVGQALEKIVAETPKRLVIASFASLIGRMQQIIDAAKKHNRKIFISGRSMVNNIEMATKMGYLKYPKGLVKELRGNQKHAENDDAIILTTGSQGESLAGLTRMALGEHKDVKLKPTDTVVYSSSPIMGNERAIIAVVNELARKGIKVINNKEMDVHTSGHGHQEDLKLMINLVKPKYFMPVHGEYYMRSAHGELAMQQGIHKNNIILADNGSIVECTKGSVQLSKKSIDCKYILVDGKGMGEIGAKVLSERQAMAQNGVLIMSVTMDKKGRPKGEPRIESHGFIYMGEEEKIMKELCKAAKTALKNATSKKTTKATAEQYLKRYLDKFTHDIIERRPLIVPIIHIV